MQMNVQAIMVKPHLAQMEKVNIVLGVLDDAIAIHDHAKDLMYEIKREDLETAIKLMEDEKNGI